MVIRAGPDQALPDPPAGDGDAAAGGTRPLNDPDPRGQPRRAAPRAARLALWRPLLALPAPPGGLRAPPPRCRPAGSLRLAELQHRPFISFRQFQTFPMPSAERPGRRSPTTRRPPTSGRYCNDVLFQSPKPAAMLMYRLLTLLEWRTGAHSNFTV